MWRAHSEYSLRQRRRNVDALRGPERTWPTYRVRSEPRIYFRARSPLVDGPFSFPLAVHRLNTRLLRIPIFSNRGPARNTAENTA